MSPTALVTRPTGTALTVAAPTLLRGGFFVAICTAAYLLVSKLIRTIRRNNLLGQMGTGTPDGLAIGYATRLYTAMISGAEWWNDTFGDGTDEEAMYQVAREMFQNKIGISLVSSKYQVLYGRELVTDITRELDTDQMSKFQSVLSSGLGALPLVTQPNPDYMLVSARPLLVRDEQLRPVQEVPAGVNLGLHSDSLFPAAGTPWHGFHYHDNLRFVPADAVSRVAIS